MPVIKLTQQLIDSDKLSCPQDRRRVEFCDGRSRAAVTGLYLEARQNGRSWYLRYRDSDGVSRHTKLGSANDLDLATAREKAKKLRAEIALGADPSAEKKARKSTLTFDNFWTDHCYPYLKTRKKTAAKDDERYRHRLNPALVT
jgi:hypothetical protein